MVLIGFFNSTFNLEKLFSYVLFIIRFVLSGKGRGCEVPTFFSHLQPAVPLLERPGGTAGLKELAFHRQNAIFAFIK